MEYSFKAFNRIIHKSFTSSRPEVFLRKCVLKICSKFTGERSCRSQISINLLRNFIEIAIQHVCSPVKLLHIFRTPFLKNKSEWLLLKIVFYPSGDPFKICISLHIFFQYSMHMYWYSVNNQTCISLSRSKKLKLLFDNSSWQFLYYLKHSIYSFIKII